MNAHDAWLALERVSLRLHGRLFLRDFSWQAHHGEQWAVLGPNGAGKTVLARLIGNELQPAGGTLYRAPAITPQTTAWVSFEAQRALCAEECVNCTELVGRKSLPGDIAGDHQPLRFGRYIASRVLKQRNEIIGGMCGDGVLKVEQAKFGQTPPFGQPDQVFSVEIP